MTKPRWRLELDALAEEFRVEAKRRRSVTPTDAAADALDYAAERVEERIARILEPSAMLTPEEWGLEQDPVVSDQTVRRWCKRGELDYEDGPRGMLIPAGARRRAPVADAPHAMKRSA